MYSLWSSLQSSPVVVNVFQKSMIQNQLFSKEWSWQANWHQHSSCQSCTTQERCIWTSFYPTLIETREVAVQAVHQVTEAAVQAAGQSPSTVDVAVQAEGPRPPHQPPSFSLFFLYPSSFNLPHSAWRQFKDPFYNCNGVNFVTPKWLSKIILFDELMVVAIYSQ